MTRDKLQRQSLGTLQEKIKTSRVLLVGAGGIGCELLKNLVLSCFGEIHLVDLDTIDLSNLNRQFLFRQEHIKRSKALASNAMSSTAQIKADDKTNVQVAKESAQQFNPHVKIEAYHANIKETRFNVEWFGSFDLVFNALDNLEARRHVNHMCLAADVPLIESGTTGFDGQVQVIKKGRSECYDCNPKEAPKTFPVCTIRSTPSQPIHCIVWAKSYLFAEIFGTTEDDAPELDPTETSENAKEIEKLRQEARALQVIRGSMGSKDFPRKVFEKVFSNDIVRLRDMEDMWRTRKKPEPLDFDVAVKEALGVGDAIAHQDQVTWTLAENFAVFCSSIHRLSNRLEKSRAKDESRNIAVVLAFDKDDEDTLDFVAASANLRSMIFGIETKSKFDIKQMAGNIIPAIATTNAITAGLCLLQAYKVMREDYEKARTVFLTKSADRAINAEPLRVPKADCPVCGVAQTQLDVDLERATLNDLVNDILRSELAYGEEISVRSGDRILYDQDLDENLGNLLQNMKITSDSFITVVDENEEEPRVDLMLSIVSKSLPTDSKAMILPNKIQIARKIRLTLNGTSENANETLGANGLSAKRKRTAEEAEIFTDNPAKRGKVAEENITRNGVADVDQIVILNGDETDGAIFIDD